MTQQLWDQSCLTYYMNAENEEDRYHTAYNVKNQQLANEAGGDEGAPRTKKRTKSDGEAGKPPRKKKKRDQRPIEDENAPELTEDQSEYVCLASGCQCPSDFCIL